MKNTKIFCIISLLALFFSCGGNSTSEKAEKEKTDDCVEVTSASLSGPLGKFFEIVPKSYKIDKSGYYAQVRVEVKRIAEGLPEPWSPSISNEDIDVDIKCQFFDEDGTLLNDEISLFDKDELFGLGVDESTFIKFFTPKTKNGSLSAKFVSKFSIKESSKSSSTNDTDIEDLDEAIDDLEKVFDATTKAAKTLNSLSK